MSDANAVGELSSKLEQAAWEFRKALERAAAGHRGLSFDVYEAANEVLLPAGYKLVPAQKKEVFY